MGRRKCLLRNLAFLVFLHLMPISSGWTHSSFLQRGARWQLRSNGDDMHAGLTVEELKAELRLRGLKVSGRKDELRQRLSDSVSATAASAEATPAPAFLDVESLGVGMPSSSVDEVEPSATGAAASSQSDDGRDGALPVEEVVWDPAAAPGGVEVARPPSNVSGKYTAGTRVAQEFAELEADVAGETTSEASYSKATGIVDGLTREEVTLSAARPEVDKRRERLGLSVEEIIEFNARGDQENSNDDDDDDEENNLHDEGQASGDVGAGAAAAAKDEAKLRKAKAQTSKLLALNSKTEVDAYVVATPAALLPWHASHKGHGVPVVVVAPGDLTPEGDGWQCPDLRRLADHVAFVCNSVVAVVDLPRVRDGEIRDENTAADALAVACRALQRDYNGSTAPAVVAVGSHSRHASASSNPSRDMRQSASALDAVCRGAVVPSALVLLGADARLPVSAGKQSDIATAAAAAAASSSPSPSLGRLSAPLLAIFGGQDDTSVGSSAQDAQDLEVALGKQPGMRDWRVLSMPGCGPGFAHKSRTPSSNSCDGGTSSSSAADARGTAAESLDDSGAPPWEVDDDAGDALLLLTAWLDLYNRPSSFAATVGPPAKDPSSEAWMHQAGGVL